MIWHLLEVWLLTVAAYLLGSIIGTLVYLGLARSPLARGARRARRCRRRCHRRHQDTLRRRPGLAPRREARRGTLLARRPGRVAEEDDGRRSTVTPAEMMPADRVQTREELAFDDGPVTDWTDNARRHPGRTPARNRSTSMRRS